MLKWIETTTGAYTLLVVYGIEIARLEVTPTKWAVMGRSGSKEGIAGSLDFAKQAAVLALEEVITTAMVDIRSARSYRPPGWGH